MNRFDALLHRRKKQAVRETGDELDRYLNEDVTDVSDVDLFKWWTTNSAIYPRLSRMAFDYHSIPGVFCLAQIV